MSISSIPTENLPVVRVGPSAGDPRGERMAYLTDEVQPHRPTIRKVIYCDSRTAAWIHERRLLGQATS